MWRRLARLRSRFRPPVRFRAVADPRDEASPYNQGWRLVVATAAGPMLGWACGWYVQLLVNLTFSLLG